MPEYTERPPGKPHLVICYNCRRVIYDFSRGKRPCDTYFLLCVICQARMLIEMEAQFKEAK